MSCIIEWFLHKLTNHQASPNSRIREALLEGDSFRYQFANASTLPYQTQDMYVTKQQVQVEALLERADICLHMCIISLMCHPGRSAET